MRPQRCMGNDEQCPQVQRKGQSHILVACRSLVITNTIFNEARGTIICGGLRSINAHAEQERSESTELDTVRSIQKPYNGWNSRRRSADKWGSNSVRPRPWVIRDGANPRVHACNPIARKTLRRSWIFKWVGLWSKKTHLTQNGRNIQCNTENYAPIVVPGSSTGSSSSSASTRPKSLPQNTSDASSSSPAITRRRSTSIPVLGNQLRDPTENQKHNQK